VATWPTVEAVKRIGWPMAFVINQAPPGRNSRSTEAAAGLGLLGCWLIQSLPTSVPEGLKVIQFGDVSNFYCSSCDSPVEP
jgi:hypothetical protein